MKKKQKMDTQPPTSYKPAPASRKQQLLDTISLLDLGLMFQKPADQPYTPAEVQNLKEMKRIRDNCKEGLVLLEKGEPLPADLQTIQLNLDQAPVSAESMHKMQQVMAGMIAEEKAKLEQESIRKAGLRKKTKDEVIESYKVRLLRIEKECQRSVEEWEREKAEEAREAFERVEF